MSDQARDDADAPDARRPSEGPDTAGQGSPTPKPRSRSAAMVALVVAALAVIVAVAFSLSTQGDTRSDAADPSGSARAGEAAVDASGASNAFCEFARDHAESLSGIGTASVEPAAVQAELTDAIGTYRRLAELAPANVAPAFESQVNAMQEFDEVLASVGYELDAADDELILVAMEALSEANESAPQVNAFLSDACGLRFVPDATSPGS